MCTAGEGVGFWGRGVKYEQEEIGLCEGIAAIKALELGTCWLCCLRRTQAETSSESRRGRTGGCVL